MDPVAAHATVLSSHRVIVLAVGGCATARALEPVEGLFADAVEEYTDLTTVLEQLQRWRRDNPQSFSDAFVGLSVPDVAALYVRAEVWASVL